MKRTSFRTVAAPSVAALVLGLALTGCAAGNEKTADAASSDGPKLSGTLNGAGSSAQEAAQGAWTSGFQTTNPDVTVNYDPVGSGGGREQFLAGGVDFAGSDSYLTDEELTKSKETCKGGTAIEVPNYVSPIALAFNLEGVDQLQLSAKTTSDIFSGKITTWDDPAIKAENPDAKLPGDRIVPVHRADESGTTANFTQWLSGAGEGAWTAEPGGVWPTKGGEGAQGTSGVIEAIKNGKGTIGYADESQVGDLSTASIKVGDAYQAPTADAASKAVDVSKKVDGRDKSDIAIDIDRTTTEAGTYPLVLASYVIACPTYADKAKAELVKGYLTYLLGQSGQAAAAKTAGSAPLSTEFSKDSLAVVDTITTKG